MAGAMVISEWHVAGQPNNQGEFIAIRGRAPGLVAWVLSILGVERGIRMVATAQHIQFQEGDLGGSSTRIIPLENVCSTYYGYKKPWVEATTLLFVAGVLLGGILAGSMGDVIGFLVGLAIAIVIAAIYYSTQKTMTIGLVETSAVVNQIVFKRSVLEGINLDEQSSANASDMIQRLMDNARTGTGKSSTQQGHI